MDPESTDKSATAPISETPGLFDKPANVQRVLLGLYLCCGLLLVLELVLHRHVMHPWEALWGFYPLYGFVGCVILVLVAKGMRRWLKRPADYYAVTTSAPDKDTDDGDH